MFSRCAMRSLGIATATAVAILPVGSAAGAPRGIHAHRATATAAKAPRGTKGSFTTVSAVPHSSDVWALGVNETRGAANLVARRHNGKWHREKVGLGSKGTVSALVAASSKMVWAAGVHGPNKPWIGRWNGKTFKTQKLTGLTSGSFYAMSASSPTNAWAVGRVTDPHNSVGFAAEHWNGKKWTEFPVPNLIVTSISTSSPTDAWATAGQFLLHWDGASWVEYAKTASNAVLTSVVAISKDNAVAVGYVTSTKTGATRTVIVRFNGTTWAQVPSPNPYEGDELTSISAHGSSMWAVGFGTSRVGATRTIIEHSTGGSWHLQHSPIGGYSSLNSVSAASAKRAYAVGSYRPSSDVHQVTCFAAYKGHSWKAESALA
jgi:hypothetical protein